MFCQSCGQQMNSNEKFCPNCGALAIVQPTYPPQQDYNPRHQKKDPGTKLFFFGILLTIILLIGTSVLFFYFKIKLIGWLIAIPVVLLFGLLQYFFSKKGMKAAVILFIVPLIIIGVTFLGTNLSKCSVDKKNGSSLVSSGVNLDDLGNIMNGQHFFDDGENQFYSTFDKGNKSHIYRTNNKTGKTTTIFDGFGWSFSVYKGWLYFSGNRGTKIDGTYTLFRIKTDGTELEELNDTFCYGLNFYNEYLYYTKKSSYSSTDYSICRSALDGTGEEILVQDGNGYTVVYENKLYYVGTDGFIYEANADGTNPKAVNKDDVYVFIIGGGKFIYIDNAYNLKTSNIDGSKIKILKEGSAIKSYRVNSYKNTVFYVEYDEGYITEKSAWNYNLYSIKTDGSDDKLVYSGVSNGFYINILKDKVYVLDYASDTVGGGMPAINKVMDMDGQNVKNLYR